MCDDSWLVALLSVNACFEPFVFICEIERRTIIKIKKITHYPGERTTLFNRQSPQQGQNRTEPSTEALSPQQPKRARAAKRLAATASAACAAGPLHEGNHGRVINNDSTATGTKGCNKEMAANASTTGFGKCLPSRSL